MFRSRSWILLGIILPSCGCLTQKPNTALVPANPFDRASGAEQQARTNFAPASLESAARVDSMGRRILTANPQLGMQPQFRTIGAPQAEIFHRGTTEVDVTEGLVKQCPNDGQLAAVLCQELAKIVCEREAMASPQAKAPDRLPPMEVRIGTDNAGSFGPADQLHRAELAKFEKERQSIVLPKQPLDSRELARKYLTKTGFAATDLDGVQAILNSASDNNAFAKQMSGPPATPSRSPDNRHPETEPR
jgi:hypothetical protein